MKRVLLLLTLFVCLISAHEGVSQTYKIVDGKMITIAKPKVKPVKTTMSITKGDKDYPVYKTKNGSYFILRISKKSGKEYKQYLKMAS